MKKVEELSFPDGILYYKEHTWAKKEGGLIRVGITDYAQDQLGDIIFIELPVIGDEFATGNEFGSAESPKTVSSLYMPVGGIIESVNNKLEGSPDLVNSDPYGAGWMIMVKPYDLSKLAGLLSSDGYVSFLKE